MSAIPESKDRLPRVEVEAALKGLSPGDWRRALFIATALCGGLTGWTPRDLLQEAMCSLLGEKRIWRSELHALVVLKTAMRSIASNARKHNNSSPVDDSVILDPFEPDEDDRTPTAHGRFTITPEDQLSGKQEMAALYAKLGGDEDLELLAMTWADGLRGAEACDALGWNEKKYDAARNRMLRRLKALDTDRSLK